jgi:nucleoid-associated protein YgaU
VPVSEPVSAPRSRIDGGTYVVRPGDSLWSIATRLLGPAASVAEIADEVNRLWELNQNRIGTGDPDLLPVSTELRL